MKNLIFLVSKFFYENVFLNQGTIPPPAYAHQLNSGREAYLTGKWDQEVSSLQDKESAEAALNKASLLAYQKRQEKYQKRVGFVEKRFFIVLHSQNEYSKLRPDNIPENEDDRNERTSFDFVFEF